MVRLHRTISICLLLAVFWQPCNANLCFHFPETASGAKSPDVNLYLPMICRQCGSRLWQDTTALIGVFSDQIHLHGATEAQVQFAAAHYAGAQKLLLDYTRHLRQYNPNFIVLHYRLGQGLGHSLPSGCNPTTDYISIIQGNQWIQEWPGDSGVQVNWFYHYDSQRVFNCDWGHYLMNLDDAGWRQWWSEQVIHQLIANENDGVFADSYHIPNYGFTWNPPLPVVDPAFEAEWAARQHSFTDYIKSRLASGNWKWIPNLGSMVTTRDPSDYSNVDGAMLEGFAKWDGEGSGYFDLVDWQLEMNRVLPLVREDKIIIAQASPGISDVQARQFILGTYLLIKGKYSYVNFEHSMNVEWYPEYDIPLGAPIDPLPATIDGYLHPVWNVYVRHFEHGMVLVNPSSGNRTINNLGGTYLRVYPSGGGDISPAGIPSGTLTHQTITSLTLPAHSAAILLNP